MGRTIRNGWQRLQVLFHRRRVEAELDEEMQFHLECRARAMRDQGVAADDAAAGARRAFGSTLRLRESGLEMWGWGWLDRLSQDVRWAFRTLRRAPGFTMAAVLTLALGIGANTAIFTVLRAQLLRPLPYPHAERLVWVFETSRTFMRGQPVPATEARVEAWRGQARSFDQIGTFVSSRAILTGMGPAEELGLGAVSPEIFQLLGASPFRGRLFGASENQRGRDRVAVLSHAFWQRRFGARDSVFGRQVTLGREAFTIIGVLPQGFTFVPLDRPGVPWLAPKETDLWVPVSTQFRPGQSNGRFYLGVLGRMKPGATAALAQTELASIAAARSNGRSGAAVFGLQDELVKDVRVPLFLLTGAAAFVLLIVCANVAHLQLARGMARGREMATRAAVGAGRARLVRQLLVEAVVLSTAGGLLGLLVVKASLGVLLWLAGDEVVLPAAVGVDGGVLGFALVASIGAAVLFGLLPARQAARIDLQGSLKDGGRGPVGRARRTTTLLVVVEVALALVLVACAGLMVNTVWRLRHVAVGFDPNRLVTLHLQLPTEYYEDDRSRQFIDAFLPQVRALPGVETAEAANTLPIGGAPTFAGFTIVGQPDEGLARPTAQYRVVTPGYFGAMRIPLKRGRTFTSGDRNETAQVAIINETMERTYFNGNALGRYLTQADPVPLQVVGVVGDVRHQSLRSEPLPEIYHPLAQRETSSPWLAVRVAGDPAATAASIRKLLAEAEPGAAITEVKTMDQRRANALGTSWFLVFLLVAFAALALVLALVGSYGVVSYWVSRRRPEFGVRLALGASASGVVLMVLGETLALMGAAIALGVAGAAVCTRLLSSYLYQVQPNDPFTVTAAVAVVLLTALAAAYLPARRAAATDPVVVLRQE
ncbi:MAG: ADOP family duplicated permease [Bacteroidales bacterium]